MPPNRDRALGAARSIVRVVKNPSSRADDDRTRRAQCVVL